MSAPAPAFFRHTFPRRSILSALLLGILAAAAPIARAQYSTTEIANQTQFPNAAQPGFGYGLPPSTDGTYVAYSTGNALFTQKIGGGPLRRIFAAPSELPGSSVKAKQIFPQTAVDNGIVVFLATDGGGGESGRFGLYSIKADGSEPAKRVADSTQAANSLDWSSFMNPEGVYGVFQVSKGVVVFGLSGTLYAAKVDGSDFRAIWQVPQGSGFPGCSSGGEYHNIFLTNQAFQPATDGTNYAFGAGNFLDFAAVYHGPLTTADACTDLIDSGDSINDPALKILPGQPEAGAALAFPQGQNFQIDSGYVYFGAFSANGVKSGEDYYGYFKVPLKGGKASVLVSNISHIPGLTGQLRLLGFAVRNGRFIFAAADQAQKFPESFYMTEGSTYGKIFGSGTSVSNLCVGTLESVFADEETINQDSLTADGKLVFYAEGLAGTFPDKTGPCSYSQGDYIHQPIGFFVVDTTHKLLPTETEVTISPALPVAWGQKPKLAIKVMPAVGAKNPRDLVPSGTVTVWYTNPEYFGAQQPHAPSPSAKLDADGEAIISMGPQQIGTYTYVVTYGGDTNFSSSTATNLVFALHVAAPTFSVKGATYKSAQSVYLSDATPAATIHYTLNGATPSKSSPVFSNSIEVSKSQTIKAIAFATGDAQSAVATATYVIK